MIASSSWATVFEWEKKQKKLAWLEEQGRDKNVWDDHKKAGKLFKQIEDLKKEIESWILLEKGMEDLGKFLEEASSEEEENLAEEQYVELKELFAKFESEALYFESYDENDAILSLHAGAGGTDAQDWTEMLLRMFLKYAERKGYETHILHETRGSEAGMKSVTVEVSGKMAFGNLKAEAGVHRLVRLSPFNSGNLRQTSFALVEVIPLVENSKELEIAQKDIKVDTYRSSGAGGQSVNTTDSAVRITHLPTNIVVTCQNERSQLQNKEKAMEILSSKLMMLKEEQEDDEKKKMKGEHTSAEWGSQIRSYVLHPYKLVKDHRTGVESKNPEEVLDGNLEEFIEGYLRKKQLKESKI